MKDLLQGCANQGSQVDRETELCATAPNIWGSSVWNFLQGTVLAFGIKGDP